MMVGEEVFNAADGYDADMWDDTALIRNYERAYEASRELMRRRKEARKKDWSLGDLCRILHAEDGMEYEGVIVQLSARRATVRLHGYNDEVEVGVADLEASLGQQEIDEQVAQAKLDQVEEVPFEGDCAVGKDCRARWSVDDIVYEGTIEAVELKKRRVKVRFVGYENVETVSMDQLYASKGMDWRQQQIEEAGLDFSGEAIDNGIDELLNEHSKTFSHAQLPDLGKLNIIPEFSDTAERNEDNTKHRNRKSSKQKGEKSTKKRKGAGARSSDSKQTEISSGALPDPSYEPAFPVLHDITPSLDGMQTNLRGGANSTLLPTAPGGSFLNPVPSASSTGEGFPPLLIPPPPPQPPPIPAGATPESEALHSMLISWYMAGYHTGYYQASVKQSGKQ